MSNENENNVFDDMLDGMQDMWEAGKESKPGLPDGTYNMQLQEANMGLSKKGNLMIKLSHLVLDGEHEGTVVRSNLLCMTEENFYYVSQWIELMGFMPPSKMSELPKTVEEISDTNPSYTAATKQSGDFTNVYPRELIDGGSLIKGKTEPEPEPEPGDITPEDIEPDPPAEDLPDGFIVGADVTFDYDGETAKAKIISITSPDAIEIEDSEGEIFDVELSDLTLVKEKKSKPKKSPKKKTAKPNEDSQKIELFAFMTAQEVSEGLSDEDGMETLVTRLNEYDWEEKELVPDEITLLNSAGIKTIAAKKKRKTKK